MSAPTRPQEAAAPSAEPAVAVPPADTGGTFASLRLRDFRLLLTGTTLSNAGQWIQQVTLGWLVYDLTASGTMLGTINLVRSVATLGLAPVSGVAIDRFARRTLMLAVNAWLFIISLGLGLLLLFGDVGIAHLLIFTFLGGVAQAVDIPLRQTAVFTLVPRALAPNAVALIQTGWALMRSLGPGLGGFLILWFGPGGNFLIQAIAYALIALTTVRIAFPPGKVGGTRPAFLSNLGDGLRYVAREPGTRAFVLMGWVLPIFIIPNFAALPPIYAKDIFGGGPEVLGLLLSSVGVGGIAGGLVTASLGRVERRGLVQLAALALTSAALIAFALTSTLWLALPLLAASGFFEMIYLTTNQTLLQLSIPEEMRGRVTGIVSLNAGLSPLGSFFAGLGADLFGPRAITVALCTVAALIAALALVASPTIRDYRLSRALTQQQ
jgi:MFS family permease